MSLPRLSLQQAKRLKVDHLWPQPPPSRFASDGMNKTERRFSGILEAMKDQHEIKDWAFEAEKFRMADKTWFKPDFRVTLLGGQIVFVEVKVRKKDGSILWTDDGAVKVKTTAELHPYPLFLAVQGEGRWEITRLPSRSWGWIEVNIDWRL